MEEQPRKLESVIQVQHTCLNFKNPEPASVAYQEQAQDLVFNENVLLQTLGFDVAVDHPHTHVVKTCHLVKGKHSCNYFDNKKTIFKTSALSLYSVQRSRPGVVFPRIKQV